jgi:IS1 family transposase
MNRLSTEQRARVLAALVEGNSIRSTVRLTGVAKNTVQKLLLEVGAACAAYQAETIRNLRCRRIQVDEIWSFCACKEKNVLPSRKGILGFGDVWTFTAIDQDTKLVPCWRIGHRDLNNASAFMEDLASRLATRVQLTSDGHRMYLDAVEHGFGPAVDFAQLQKLYGADPEAQKRYSPAKCIGAVKAVIVGSPDPGSISTSHVERCNLTMRMSMRRFTRLTNAFSKRIENLKAAVALHFMYYNFARIHQTLRVTPAMAAGVSDKLWEVKDIAALLD